MNKPYNIRIFELNIFGKMMKNWNRASVLGNSGLFFHHFALHHFA